MSHFSNTKKDAFLNSFPKLSIEDKDCNIMDRCKFNFSYLDTSQEAGQDFKDLTQIELTKLCNKLKEYNRESLEHWRNVKIGSGEHRNSILVQYGDFPRKSDFEWPKSVPYQAVWERFRLDQSTRLVGFTIPSEYNNTCNYNKNAKFNFDCNTFYVVFLDKNHLFFKTK